MQTLFPGEYSSFVFLSPSQMLQDTLDLSKPSATEVALSEELSKVRQTLHAAETHETLNTPTSPTQDQDYSTLDEVCSISSVSNPSQVIATLPGSTVATVH